MTSRPVRFGPRRSTWPGTAPPAPLVVLGRLAAPGPGLAESLGDAAPHRLVGLLATTSPPATVAERAVAAALSTGARHGWLAREAAAWVWSGDPQIRPEAVTVAADTATELTERGVLPWATVTTRVVRATLSALVVRVAGVALSDPASTALDCARLLPPDEAVACLRALDSSGRCSLAQVRDRLETTAAGSRRRAALAALARAGAPSA